MCNAEPQSLRWGLKLSIGKQEKKYSYFTGEVTNLFSMSLLGIGLDIGLQGQEHTKYSCRYGAPTSIVHWLDINGFLIRSIDEKWTRVGDSLVRGNWELGGEAFRNERLTRGRNKLEFHVRVWHSIMEWVELPETKQGVTGKWCQWTEDHYWGLGTLMAIGRCGKRKEYVL